METTSIVRFEGNSFCVREFSSYWIDKLNRVANKNGLRAFCQPAFPSITRFHSPPPFRSTGAIYLTVLPRSLIPRECRSQSVSDSIIYSRPRGYKESWLEYRNAIYIDALYRGWLSGMDGESWWKIQRSDGWTGSKSLLETSEINVGRAKGGGSYPRVKLFHYLSNIFE